MHAIRIVILAVLLFRPLLAMARLTPERLAQLPDAATRPVNFIADIQPILEASCIKCHGRGKAKGGFRLDNREAFLQPGDSGPAVAIGDSARSHLIELVSGLDPDSVMPQKGTKLTREQVGLMRAWIDQGLKWDAAVSFARPPAKNLTPRKPALPVSEAEKHPIDQWMQSYFASHGVSAAGGVDDRAWLRRVSLDSVGMLPDPAEAEVFARDSAPDKKLRMVRRFLSDKHRYAQHWLTFWNDLLRNDYRGTGYIDGGRKQITEWLYAALRDNVPYDRFVRELVNPSAASEGFTKGIVWRGAVNASMTPPMQAAQNISQVFMGVNLKCASCHDSFIDDWQLSEAYGLAGIYADGPLEMVLCDKPLGKTAPLRFLFPELGVVNPGDSRADRLKQIADLITRPENGRLSRTIVNRLWARLFGRGLVEPLDVMQNEGWNPDLLDWLAEDLVANSWDLKRTIEIMLTSSAYALPTVPSSVQEEKQYVFRGPTVRRLSAEQFRDALGQLTGVWGGRQEGNLLRELSLGLDLPPLPAAAFWIWNDVHAVDSTPPGSVFFRKTFELPAVPQEATVWVNVDDDARVFVNGESVALSAKPSWNQFVRADILPRLHAGANVIAIEGVNVGDKPSPAGLLVYVKIRTVQDATNSGAVLDFASDASWRVATNSGSAWTAADFGASQWQQALVLGDASLAPWKAGPLLAAAVTRQGGFGGQFRSSLASSDPLLSALGRPNREQVQTVRQSTATTLQMLELTNGRTLARLLKEGAKKLIATAADTHQLAELIFRRGLGRAPGDSELRMTSEMLGKTPQVEAVEDLLWSVAMLPEFQIIL
ncbi:MAG: DUF1549 domain-containing protein [Pedosphaera sp.]|nr:DUF1549 domain-containing protein [Pedosphaera sp.]